MILSMAASFRLFLFPFIGRETPLPVYLVHDKVCKCAALWLKHIAQDEVLTCCDWKIQSNPSKPFEADKYIGWIEHVLCVVGCYFFPLFSVKAEVKALSEMSVLAAKLHCRCLNGGNKTSSDPKRWVRNINAPASISSKRIMLRCHFFSSIVYLPNYVTYHFLARLGFHMCHYAVIHSCLTASIWAQLHSTPLHSTSTWSFFSSALATQWGTATRRPVESTSELQRRQFYLLYSWNRFLWESTGSRRSSFNPKLIMVTACVEAYH